MPIVNNGSKIQEEISEGKIFQYLFYHFGAQFIHIDKS